MSDIALPKNQAVLDRLRRRIENYRQHHNESIPRFEHTTNGLNEQQKNDTLLLKQRYLENKAKKSQKNKEKKDGSGVTVSLI
jgi:mastermind-like protein